MFLGEKSFSQIENYVSLPHHPTHTHTHTHTQTKAKFQDLKIEASKSIQKMSQKHSILLCIMYTFFAQIFEGKIRMHIIHG